MKLARYGNIGEERPALLDARGNLRDLSSVVPDIGPKTLTAEALRKAGAELVVAPAQGEHDRVGDGERSLDRAGKVSDSPTAA